MPLKLDRQDYVISTGSAPELVQSQNWDSENREFVPKTTADGVPVYEFNAGVYDRTVDEEQYYGKISVITDDPEAFAAVLVRQRDFQIGGGMRLWAFPWAMKQGEKGKVKDGIAYRLEAGGEVLEQI